MTLTDEQLAGIEARLEAATPGPWEGITDRDEFLTMSPLGYGDGVIIKFTERFGCEMASNAALITHAPTDIRALLDEVERLREVITFARAAYRDDDFPGGDRILTVALGENES